MSFGSALGNNHGFVIQKIIIHGILVLFVEETGKHVLNEMGLKKKKRPSHSRQPVEYHPGEFFLREARQVT